MKVKKVNRYNCDYCNKKGYSAGHMHKHEKHCTMNPARKCRMCEELDQVPLEKLIALLPNPENYIKPIWGDNALSDDVLITGSYYNGYEYTPELVAAIDALRKKSQGCPACMLSVIRQSKIPVPVIRDFNYKKEVAEWWNKVNILREYEIIEQHGCLVRDFD